MQWIQSERKTRLNGKYEVVYVLQGNEKEIELSDLVINTGLNKERQNVFRTMKTWNGNTLIAKHDWMTYMK